MTKNEASDLVAQVCEGQLNIGYTEHFWWRVDERVPGFSRLNAMNVLRRGVMGEPPVKDRRYGNYIVKLVAEDTDFGWVELVVALRHFSDAVGITIYEVKRKGRGR